MMRSTLAVGYHGKIPHSYWDEKLAAVDLRTYDPATIRSALEAALLDEIQLTEASTLSSKLKSFIEDLAAAGDSVECSWDPTVSTTDTGEATALEKAGA